MPIIHLSFVLSEVKARGAAPFDFAQGERRGR